MRIERTKNTVKNIRAGMVLRVYQMIVPFLMRTAMIYFLGVQYLGLNGLFASILQVLNLAELGVGRAMVFAMYKPIAQDDEKSICALMGIYRKYYRIIGLLIGVVGILITPFVPKLITGDIPGNLNIYTLYLLNLGATVLTYWLFAYKNCLLQAHQRQDIVSWITASSYTVQCVIQLMILLVYKNYYAYVIVTLAAQVFNNLATAAVVNKRYPTYKPAGKLPAEEVKVINGKIRDLFTAKLGSVVLKSSDTLVISAFLGLTVLAIYQNYYFVLSSVLAIVEIILSSMMAGLGNSYVLETKEKNFQNMEKFTFLFLWLTGVCSCCFLGMYQPFMKIWVGSELMMDYGPVVLLVAYFFIQTLNRLLSVYKDAAGMWHEDRFRPLITAMINLMLNLLWIRSWGIYGVLISTIVSMLFVGIPWMLHNIFSVFFGKHLLKNYVKILLSFGAAVVISGAITRILCVYLVPGNDILALAICACISVIVPNVLFYLFFSGHRLFAESVKFCDRLTKKKFKLESILIRK